LKSRIDTDLECLEHGRPFDGIFKGMEERPSDLAGEPKSDDPTTAPDS
jgi:hypothetical protein